MRHTSSRLLRRSASTESNSASTGRYTSVSIRTRFPEPAFKSALEVLAGNSIEVMVDAGNGYTPTPVISHAILSYNRGRRRGLADGIVITPSHNPPRFGGFKYDPPHGGPADTHVTAWIEEQANALISDQLRSVARIPIERARTTPTVHQHDYLNSYVNDLPAVVDLEAIKHSMVASGSIRWAAPAWPIGMQYGIAMDSISKSSITQSTQRSGS